MSAEHRLRVLHCPHSVGGHPQGLARAERELGLASTSVSFYPSRLGYPPDEILFAPPRSPPIRELRRWSLLRRALRDFDVVHFNFGSTIMPSRWPRSSIDAPDTSSLPHSLFALYAGLFELRDLAWLRRAGKAICVTFQGDDARQADFSRERFEVTHVRELPARLTGPELDRKKRRTIAAFDRYAHRIYALNPDLLHVLPRRADFLAYAHVDLQQWRPAEPRGEQVPLVVHAPSDRAAKGTRFLLEAVSRLRAEGVQIELALVEGQSLEEARRIYERADLVVDQLLVGWYGGLAVEAMALAKPVVAYIRESDLAFVPEPMTADLPIIGASPETVEAVLRTWLTARRGELPEVGRRSRAYVERWHDPRRIGKRLVDDYEAARAAARSGRTRR